MSSDADQQRRLFRGRRHGRRLRTTQKRLLTAMLPALSVEIDGGVLQPHRLFMAQPDAVWLEIGFGGGEHLAAQAQAHPEVGFIGCEPFINGVAQLLQAVERNSLENIRIFPDDARLLLDALPEASVDRCFVLFPDPWPKRRHQRRRIISPDTLDALARVLRDDAVLRLASDHKEYIRWMLFHTIGHGAFDWQARGAADWRERPPDWPATRYEEKAATRGVDSIYLAFRRRPRG